MDEILNLIESVSEGFFFLLFQVLPFSYLLILCLVQFKFLNNVYSELNFFLNLYFVSFYMPSRILFSLLFL